MVFSLFQMDKNYVGPLRETTVRFSGLNDNVNRQLLHELCESYGEIQEYKVYFDPKTNKHTGTGKVVFDKTTSARNVVNALDGKRVMGDPIKAWIETKCK